MAKGRSSKMSRVILLDAGPLGIVSNPRFSSQTLACHQWVKDRLTSGAQVLIPEIADYEVRRELLRANKTRSREIERVEICARLFADHNPGYAAGC